MDFKKIALIGVGQIGSRHLQALLKCDFPVNLEVVEPYESARQTATARMREVQKSPLVKAVRFAAMEELPPELDLVIIATNAKDRLSVLSKLLEKSRVKNIILEKVLFPSLEDLGTAEQLLTRGKARTWVNCPKRTYTSVAALKKKLNYARPFRMEVNGFNWGLACNSIHFIDLAAFLTSDLFYEINTEKLDHKILESKRSGYVEFSGTLQARFRNGAELILTSRADGPASFQSAFFQNGARLDFQEEAPPMSSLTQRFARQILLENSCDLTPFQDSAQLHRPLLNALLEHYSLLRGHPQKEIPIT